MEFKYSLISIWTIVERSDMTYLLIYLNLQIKTYSRKPLKTNLKTRKKLMQRFGHETYDLIFKLIM